MADAVLFVGWTEPRTGREKAAGALFNESVEFYSSKVAEGTLESFEPVILARHGGDLNGFFLLRGEREKLDRFRRTDEFLDWIMKAIQVLDGFGVIEGYVGQGLQDIMQRWTRHLQD